jgi:hypothetical protein
MSGSTVPPCQTITVSAFRGNRSRAFASAFLSALADEKNGVGAGPTSLDCLLLAGHTGVSTDRGATVYGFNPDRGSNPVWELMDGLKKGERFPGVVRDDTAVFTAAKSQGLSFWSFEIILPDPRFKDFQRTLAAELMNSQYFYGFPTETGTATAQLGWNAWGCLCSPGA